MYYPGAFEVGKQKCGLPEEILGSIPVRNVGSLKTLET